MGPHPAVAAVRLAVRRAIADLEPEATVLVACSGGADSMALLAATVFEARRPAVRVAGVTVDHGLQTGSAERAAEIAARMRSVGVQRAEVRTVSVGTSGGPEAAARAARYAALDRAATEHDAAAVLLGHTRDDQAETVLLGLARGSGSRSLAGMAAVTGRYRRPLLGVGREETLAACHAEGIEVWEDPHNADPSYTRVRVRNDVLPVLEKQLGPGIAEALARTARQLRDDADALDEYAATGLCQALDDRGGLDVERLAALPAAVRRRVLRLAALAAGCPGTELFAIHVDAVEALVTDWHGQQWVDLPGKIRAQRAGGTLTIGPAPVAG
ncbi:MAG: tRNA lysidine(34) synthetase TilS [Pseudonocardia sp.]